MITCVRCGAEFADADRRAFYRHLYVCGRPAPGVDPAPYPADTEDRSMTTDRLSQAGMSLAECLVELDYALLCLRQAIQAQPENEQMARDIADLNLVRGTIETIESRYAK